MQNQDIANTTGNAKSGHAITAHIFSRDKIPVPRCDCCGALIPLNEPRINIDEIASCIVCGHRNL
jgi:hypothetical protein